MATTSDPDIFPAVHRLPPVPSGNKWQGFEGVLAENGSAPAAAGSGVVFQIHTSEDNRDTLLELTSAASQITFNTATWEFAIVPLVMTLPEGDYFWCVSYLDNDTDPITVGIGTIPVNPQYFV